MATIELDVEIPDLAEVEVETPSVEATPSGGDTVLLVVSPGPPGRPGPPGAGVQVFAELLSGALNGSNTVFLTANPYVAASTAVYLNGVRETHYTETGPGSITFEDPPLEGDTIAIDYLIDA